MFGNERGPAHRPKFGTPTDSPAKEPYGILSWIRRSDTPGRIKYRG